jgi:MFS family permease
MSGLALGIAYAGPGIGVAIALPLAAQLIQTAGWRSTSLVFMAASLVGVAFVWIMTSGPPVIVPAPGARRTRAASPPVPRTTSPLGEPLSAGQITLRAAEANLAARATGLHETAAPGAVSAAQEIPPAGSGDHRHSVRRTVRTRRFWILFAGAAAIGVFDEGVLQAFLPAAVSSGIRADAAAAALGFQALAYVAGQVIGGWLSDRVGRRIVGLAAAVLVAGGVVAAIGLVSASPVIAIAGLALHGVGTGATIAVRSAAFGDVFRGPTFGTIFGLLAVAYPIGGSAAVYVGALAFDATGSYGLLVPVVLLAVVVWSVSLWVAGPRRRHAPAVATTAA